MAGLVGLTVLAFIAIVGPLFTISGTTAAEIDGTLPSSLAAGHTDDVQLSIDNTGDTNIHPICVAFGSDPTLTLMSVTFQGIETINASDGVACGGALTSQETISIVLHIRPSQPGVHTISVEPRQGNAAVGKTYSASVNVTS